MTAQERNQKAKVQTETPSSEHTMTKKQWLLLISRQSYHQMALRRLEH